MAFPILSVAFFLSLISTFIVIDYTIKKLRDKKYFGTADVGFIVPDLHKKGKPLVPKLGGVGILFGITLSLIFCIAYFTFTMNTAIIPVILAALTSILLMGLVGLLDDIFKVRYILRILAPILAALPLIAIQAGDTSMAVPFLGVINFGIVYFIFVVAGMMVASNAMNMIAGFNGLEAGLGIISCSAMLILALLTNQQAAAVILISAIGALLAFLIFNFYPARCLPGNMTTYMIGTIIAAAAIIGNMERTGVILFIPYAFEFFLKARSGFDVKWWGKLQRDGTLRPASKIVSLPQLLMKINRVTERRLVLEMYLIQIAFAVFAIWISVI